MSDQSVDETMPEQGPPLVRIMGSLQSWGASDLFLCEDKVPAVRLHGAVRPLEYPPTTKQDLQTLIKQAVPQTLREKFEKTGDLDVGFSMDADRRFRLNLARQQGRIAVVARALPSGALEFEGLHLPLTLRRLAEMSRGLVLVTGATGSGKSTTLAAMVHHINVNRRCHIVTLEEPIEFLHNDIKSRMTQREVGVDTVSFQVGLRQAVRESPDVILIGELRDEDTVRTAMQAALTGHLVLASLHTIDASQTLQRIVGYFPDHQRAQVSLDLSMCLKGVVAQRLLPRADHQGRVVAVEMLMVSPAAARLIREQQVEALQDLMRTSDEPGMQTFNDALLTLYKDNMITHEQGMAYATEPEEFALHAKGIKLGVSAFRAEADDVASTGLDMKRLLHEVQARGASDLHLSVNRPPTLRITGRLVPLDIPALNAADMRVLLYSILSVRQRTTYELERELDFALALDTGQRYRVNAYYEKGNMAAALRSIPRTPPPAESLGLPPALLSMGEAPHGLLLAVGPTGAGKTTTLACLTERINQTRDCHILTVEDPIEYHYDGARATIHQREVGADTKSFSAALKYILRQDPDVILVGEMRDLETVSAALTAAETGHLVMGTLHTNDAVQTVDRIVDVFPAHQQAQARTQLAASLLGVVSQRLLPRADGQGRVGAFELLVATPAIRNMIRDNKMHQAASAMQSGKAQGMITLDESLMMLVDKGLVTVRDAMRYVNNPAIFSGS
ncbi:MAG: type IV pilus twitching motility protein PilT [Bradymonadia bacterium]